MAPGGRLLLAACWLVLVVPAPAAASQLSVSLDPGTTRADAVQIAQGLGARIVDAIPQLDAYLLELPSRLEARVAVRRLASDERVRSAQPDRSDRLTRAVDDPFRDHQWHLTQLDAEDAWDLGIGDPGVVIAILDSGIELDHPDLAGKLVPGTDVADGDDDPTDVVGHGTIVAGAAAARTDNGIGVAGVCPACLLLPVKVTEARTGSVSKFDSAQGLVWATDHGADVINMSFGSGDSDPVQADGVAYALAHGVVVVASAGNIANDDVQYPAAYDGVIAVAASTQRNELWSGSSFGPWVDVAAPGVDILSTHDGAYGTATGTSFAAPIVSGAAGLALSLAPGALPEQVADWLTTGTVPLAGTTLRRLDLPRVLRRASGGPVEPDPPPPLVFRPFAVSPGTWFLRRYEPPTAGEEFAAGGRVLRDDTDRVVPSGALTCRAHVGRRTLRLVEKSFAHGLAICVWQVPENGTARKAVHGVVSVQALGAKVAQPFSATVRRG